jgi:hypothetical protein
MATIKIVSVGLKKGFYDYGIQSKDLDAFVNELAKKLKDELSLAEYLEERHSSILLDCFLKTYLTKIEYDNYIKTAYLHYNRSERSHQEVSEQKRRTRTTASAIEKTDRITKIAYGYERPKQRRISSQFVEDETLANTAVQIEDVAEDAVPNNDIIQFNEAFNINEKCCICFEEGEIITMGKLPCECKYVMHKICLEELLHRHHKCPFCRVEATYYTDGDGNYIKPEARIEDWDYVETYEQLRARNAIKRMKEKQEQEDEILNSEILLRNEQAEQNRNENKDKHDKERNERREQRSSNGNGYQPKSSLADIESVEEQEEEQEEEEEEEEDLSLRFSNLATESEPVRSISDIEFEEDLSLRFSTLATESEPVRSISDIEFEDIEFEEKVLEDLSLLFSKFANDYEASREHQMRIIQRISDMCKESLNDEVADAFERNMRGL